MARLLADAVADTTSPVRLTNGPGGELAWSDTPTGYINNARKHKRIGGKKATEQQLNVLEAIRRLLLRGEAVHAVSWLWPDGAASMPEDDAAAEETSRTTTPSTPLTLTMPTLRRRAARRRALLAALYRRSSKP
eukprot:g14329.t1